MDITLTQRKSFTLPTWLMPILLLCIVLSLMLPVMQGNDQVSYFVPAAQAMQRGISPYTVQAIQPFLYLPPALPLFTMLAGTPPLVLLVGSLLALGWCIYRLHISSWWLLSPYCIYVLVAGQIDLLVLALAIEAYHRRNGWLMVVAIIIKPQVAVFFLLPLLAQNRRLWLVVPLGVGSVAGLSFIATPTLWLQWMDAVLHHGGAYLQDGMALWSIHLGIGALVAMGLWFLKGKDLSRSRCYLALGLPAQRYYSGVGLLGVLPAHIALPLSCALLCLTLLLGVPLVWLEPICSLVYLGWQSRSLQNLVCHQNNKKELPSQ